MSAKGQVVIPKATRERWHFGPGTQLEVVETDEGVLLKPRRPRGGETFDEVTARLRKIVHYDGPIVSIAEMNATIASEWARSGERGSS